MVNPNESLVFVIEKNPIPSDLSGVAGSNRTATRSMLNADDDLAAIKAWLSRYADKATTYDSYRKEAERLILWSIKERKKPVSSLEHQDLQAYQQFLKNPSPQERWVMAGKKVSRSDPAWKPFTGPLSISSQRQAMLILNGMFNWLYRAGYLASNPWVYLKVPKIKQEGRLECGLSNCHQWHQDGFLVELMNGKRTNVGNVCGAKFGDKYLKEREYYFEKEFRPQALHQLGEFYKSIKSSQLNFHEISLKSKQASHRKKALKHLIPSTFNTLQKMQSNNQYIVYEDVKIDRSEIEEILAMNPSLKVSSIEYYQNPIGEIKGINIISFNFITEVNNNYINKIERIEAIVSDASKVNTAELISLKNWIDNHEDNFKRISNSLIMSNNFFTKENLEIISYLAKSDKEKSTFKSLTIKFLDQWESLIKEILPIPSQKPLNRKERRKLQFASNNTNYKDTA